MAVRSIPGNLNKPLSGNLLQIMPVNGLTYGAENGKRNDMAFLDK